MSELDPVPEQGPLAELFELPTEIHDNFELVNEEYAKQLTREIPYRVERLDYLACTCRPSIINNTWEIFKPREPEQNDSLKYLAFKSSYSILAHFEIKKNAYGIRKIWTCNWEIDDPVELRHWQSKGQVDEDVV